jgi:hypothetical protein
VLVQVSARRRRGKGLNEQVVSSATGGVLIIDSDRTFASDSPVCAYWLTRCEGFTVRSGRHQLGMVESVAGSPLGLAETLQVHSRYRQRSLDAGKVSAVVPGRRLLIVEPARSRVRPVARSVTWTAANSVVTVSALLARLVAFLVPRVATGVRVSAVTTGRLTRDEVLPRVRTGLTLVIDEVERLTLLDGEAQSERDQPHPSAPQEASRPTDSEGIAGQPQQRQQTKAEAERRERRNRARVLRQQAREEDERLRAAEVAEQALP